MNWKGLVANFLVFWFLPGAASILTLLWFRTSAPRDWSEERLRRFCAAGFVVSRVVYAVVLYFVLLAPAGGDVRYFYEHSIPVMHGQVLGRDTENLYAPLLPYLHAGGVAIFPGHHFLGIMVAPFLAEILILFAAAAMGEDLAGPPARRWIVAWLVLTPLLWHQTVVRGGEEPIFAGTLALGAWLVHRGRSFRGGIVLGFGFCATKVSFGPYALAILLAQFAWERRGGLRAIGGFLLTATVVFGAYAASGADPLGFNHYGGNNLWIANVTELVGKLFPAHGRLVLKAVYGGAMVLTVGWLGARRRDSRPLWHFISAVVAVQSVCMVMQPYVTANYVVQALPFSLMVLHRHRGERMAHALLVLLPVLAFFIAVTSDSRDSLYETVATPLSLVFHMLLLVLVAGDLRRMPEGEAAPVGPAAVPG